MTTSDLVKVRVPVPDDHWSGSAAEWLWARPTDKGTFVIENVPFHAYGLSYGDEVVATTEDDALEAVEVVSRGGHSTYRIFLEDGVEFDSPRFNAAWEHVARAGATFERADERLLAVDVPSDASVHDAYNALTKGEGSGVWQFEEGHSAP